jgi:hypothetical protein
MTISESVLSSNWQFEVTVEEAELKNSDEDPNIFEFIEESAVF